jgi:hypothetical protein
MIVRSAILLAHSARLGAMYLLTTRQTSDGAFRQIVLLNCKSRALCTRVRLSQDNKCSPHNSNPRLVPVISADQFRMSHGLGIVRRMYSLAFVLFHPAVACTLLVYRDGLLPLTLFASPLSLSLALTASPARTMPVRISCLVI